MRRRFLTLFAVAMTAITLLTPSFAGAAELDEGVILDENSRDARAHTHYQRGCFETHISLFATTQHQQWIDGSTYDNTVGGFSIDIYNNCTEEPVISVEDYNDTLGVNINDKLIGASLTGDMMTRNIIGDNAPDVRVKFNVYWVPAGRLNTVEEVSDITATLPGGEEVPAILHFTELDRRTIALGVVTVDNQVFPIFARGEDAELFGFDATWTHAPAQN